MSERDFPGGSNGNESTCFAGDLGSIPGLGRSPGEVKGYPFQYCGLENSMNRGAWQATVHRVAKSQILPSDFHFQLLASVFLTWLVIMNVVTFRNAYFFSI